MAYDIVIGIELHTCEVCGGSGVIVFGCHVYEDGCGFPHSDTYEETCDCCGGFGEVEEPLK